MASRRRTTLKLSEFHVDSKSQVGPNPDIRGVDPGQRPILHRAEGKSCFEKCEWAYLGLWQTCLTWCFIDLKRPAHGKLVGISRESQPGSEQLTLISPVQRFATGSARVLTTDRMSASFSGQERHRELALVQLGKVLSDIPPALPWSSARGFRTLGREARAIRSYGVPLRCSGVTWHLGKSTSEQTLEVSTILPKPVCEQSSIMSRTWIPAKKQAGSMAAISDFRRGRGPHERAIYA